MSARDPNTPHLQSEARIREIVREMIESAQVWNATPCCPLWRVQLIVHAKTSEAPHPKPEIRSLVHNEAPGVSSEEGRAPTSRCICRDARDGQGNTWSFFPDYRSDCPVHGANRPGQGTVDPINEVERTTETTDPPDDEAMRIARHYGNGASSDYEHAAAIRALVEREKRAVYEAAIHYARMGMGGTTDWNCVAGWLTSRMNGERR